MIEPVRVVGRYALYAEIAAGGMATVHFGRLLGQVGFSRTVAIKRLHPHFAKDEDFVSMFLDEAHIASRIRHPNVIGPLDIVATEGELFLVMDYVHGESLSRLTRGGHIPPRVAVSILCGALHGLHAAHEAKNEQGEPLHIVHRDVSPHNILVGVDGIARVLDFGVAKARGRVHTTRDGALRGKLAYMAPEQFRGTVDQRSDIYAAAIVAWEALTGRTLFVGDTEAETMAKLLNREIEVPSTITKDLPRELDAIVLRGLELDPVARYATAREMAIALEACGFFASPSEVGEWVASTASEALAKRAARMSQIESSSPTTQPETADLMAELKSGTDLSVAAKDGSQPRVSRPPPASSRSYPAAASATPAHLKAPVTLDFASATPVTSPSTPATYLESSRISALGAPLAERPGPLRSRARWTALLALLAVIAAFALVWQWRAMPAEPRGDPQAATAGPAPLVLTAGSESPSAAPSAAASAAEASASASAPKSDEPSPPSASSTAASRSRGAQPGAASKPGSRTAPTSTANSGAPQAHPAGARGAKPGCDPPYTLDALGHRHYRVECL